MLPLFSLQDAGTVTAVTEGTPRPLNTTDVPLVAGDVHHADGIITGCKIIENIHPVYAPPLML